MTRRNILAVSILAIIVVSLAFFQTPLMAQTRARAWSWWVEVVSNTGGLGNFDSVRTAAEQAAELRAENIRLQAELRDYRQLRSQLSAPSVSDWQARPALLVGRPVDAFHTNFLINQGFDQDVSVGAPVVADGLYLVGVVEEVSARSSLVRTLLHPDSQFSVATVPDDVEAPAGRGLLESRFQTSLHMVTIPRDAAVTVGESVVTDSRNQALPLGLVIGHIREIEAPEHEAYQEARVDVPYDLDELRAVTVLIAP